MSLSKGTPENSPYMKGNPPYPPLVRGARKNKALLPTRRGISPFYTPLTRGC